MRTTAPQSRTTWLFGVCPACGDSIHAELVVDPRLSAPKVETLTTVTVEVDPKIVGMALTHRCGGADFPPVAVDPTEAEVSS